MLIDKDTVETVTLSRRKDARARVRLKPGSGDIMVWGRPIGEYLARDLLAMLAKPAL